MHRQARDPVEQMESSSEDQEAQIQATLAEEVKRLRAQVAQTAVASCLVPRASGIARRASCEVDTCVSSIEYLTVSDTTCDIDYLTVSDTTSIGVCLDSCASVAARQRFSRHSNSEGLV